MRTKSKIRGVGSEVGAGREADAIHVIINGRVSGRESQMALKGKPCG